MSPAFAAIRLAAFFVALAALALAPAARAEITSSAPFAIILDGPTGASLYEKNADAQMTPSSMSKLMTSAIVFEKLKKKELSLSDTFIVSERAWREREGSTMWVRVDDAISVENLLKGVIVQSGNDACIVLAEGVSGSEEAFVELMNKKAREWGLKNSTFANPHGIPDPNQKMSARDLAVLGRKIIYDYPEYFKAFYPLREFTWERITQPNRNPLFGLVAGADGLKTGHTDEAGYGLVGTAVQKGERRIIVVNGLDSEKARAQESARLFRIAFNDFLNTTLYKSGEPVGAALVFKGREATVPLATREPVSLILHRGEATKTRALVLYEGPVAAPIEEGQQIGFLRIEPASGDPREYPLFAVKAVKEIGPLGKILLAAKTILAKPEKPAASLDAASGEAETAPETP